MARDGLNESQIIKHLDITQSKFNSLKRKSDDLKKELSYGKLLTDYAVEDALLKKALGGISKEVKETEKDSGSEMVTVTKEIPADTSALQFWLKNRCPEKWNEKNNSAKSTEEMLESIMERITEKAKEINV